MKRLKVLVDVDCVLSDFVADCVKLIAPETTKQQYRSLVTDVWQIASELNLPESYNQYINVQLRELITRDDKLGFAATMTVADGSREFIQKLSDLSEVLIVTSPLYENTSWCSDRVFWLKQHFNISQNKIIFTKNKSNIKGDILIDDDLRHVLPWAEENPCKNAVLWSGCIPNRTVDNLPHNVHHYVDWDDVLNLIKTLSFYD
jgi:5'(3')-deoxyribonucleotidase